MRLLSLPEEKYNLLPPNLRIKRAKLFTRLVTILECSVFYNLDKVRTYIENHLTEDDFEYMNIEELLLMREHGFIGDDGIFDLFPEEFDFLDGVPVLMVDDL